MSGKGDMGYGFGGYRGVQVYFGQEFGFGVLVFYDRYQCFFGIVCYFDFFKVNFFLILKL